MKHIVIGLWIWINNTYNNFIPWSVLLWIRVAEWDRKYNKKCLLEKKLSRINNANQILIKTLALTLKSK